MTARGLAGVALVAIAIGTQAWAQDVSGAWTGTYRCAQGVTGLELSLRQDPGGDVDGLFHFFAAPANPGVPEGCYDLHGHLDAASGRITLRAGQWLLRPNGYIAVDLSGTLDPGGDRLAGRIDFPSCDKFTLHRTAKLATIPPACHPPEVSVSSTPTRATATR
jgi:hypothetical protein